MAVQEIRVQRVSVTSAQPFESVVAAFEAAVGRVEKGAFEKEMGAASDAAALARVVEKAVGKSGFLLFVRFDLGAVLRKEGRAAKILRFVIGNPLIMKEMAKRVPDAGSYAPVTVLIDERPDGVHLSYDRMASCLATYGDPEAVKLGQALDTKVEKLLSDAAA